MKNELHIRVDLGQIGIAPHWIRGVIRGLVRNAKPALSKAGERPLDYVDHALAFRRRIAVGQRRVLHQRSKEAHRTFMIAPLQLSHHRIVLIRKNAPEESVVQRCLGVKLELHRRKYPHSRPESAG